MSNKFLPFIVEKSPLHSIYQTMLSRSKGVNSLIFLNVFHAVGKHGIKAVREYVNSQSEKMDTNSLYQAIANHFDESVFSADYSAFMLLEHSMTVQQLTENSDKYSGYSYQDILGFIFVISLLQKNSEYFKIDYELYLSNYSIAKQNIKLFMNLVEVNPDIEILVESEDQLISKVLYYSLINYNPDNTYKFTKAVSSKAADDEEKDRGASF
jgi:hypothetical protein